MFTEINGVFVNSVKLNHIKALLDIIPKYTHIKEVFLFGSILRDDCTNDSDIDIVILGDVPITKIGYSLYEIRSYIFERVGYTDIDILYHRVSEKCKLLKSGFISEEWLIYVKK